MSDTQITADEIIPLLRSPLWGIIVSIGLYGIILSQAWIYANKNSDGWYLRAAVTIIVMADFASVVLEAEIVNYIFLENFMNPYSVQTFPTYMPSLVLLSVLVIFVVQIFFASRVYFVYNRSIIRGGLVVATAWGSFVPGILMAIDMYRNPALLDVGSHYRKTVASLFASFSACCDIATTIMLSRKLYVAHSNVKRTNNVIQKLLIYVVTRGFLVSAVHITNLVLYLVEAEKLYWSVTYFCLSRVYLLTMLGMLNSRYELRESMQDDAGGGIDLRSMIGSGERARRGILDINVQTVQLVVKDGTEHTTATMTNKEAPYLPDDVGHPQAV